MIYDVSRITALVNNDIDADAVFQDGRVWLKTRQGNVNYYVEERCFDCPTATVEHRGYNIWCRYSDGTPTRTL